jgi:hypothetical protein
MVESLSDFPFRKLRDEKFLALELILYIEHPEMLQFMFSVNKDTRKFLESNFIAIRNGFFNEGLITYELSSDFNNWY